MAVLAIRPRLVRSGATPRQMVPAVLAIVVSLVVGGGTLGDRAPWYAAGLGLGLSIGLLSWLAVRTSELRWADGVLTYGGLLGRRTLGDAASPVKVVKVTIVAPPEKAAQVWVGANTSVVLMERSWGASELDAFSQKLGLHVTTEPAPQTWAELRDAYPRSVPWLAAYASTGGYVLATIIVIGIVVWESVR